jgi:hypothetical protein
MSNNANDTQSSDDSGELDIATLRLALDEQRRAFDKVDSSADALDQKLQALFGSASLIISLIGTLQIAILRDTAGVLFWVILGVVALLYSVMVIIILVGLQPLEYYEPTFSNWNTLDARLFHKPERDAVLLQIALYLDYIELNKEINNGKIAKIRWAAGLFGLILLILLVSMSVSFATAPSPNAK